MMHAHQTGIFDVKWSPCDTMLATASADHTVKISSMASSSSNAVLHTLVGQSSTPKCIAWDPSHGSILCTGARDGSICLYDLRVSNSSSRKWLIEEQQDNTIEPVLTFNAAPPQGKRRTSKWTAPMQSTTSLVFPDNHPHSVVSSNALDGTLRMWDFRNPLDRSSQGKSMRGVSTSASLSSPTDPTTFGGTQRARGITSLATGSGPSAGLLFALSTDARIHTYSLPSLEPLSGQRGPEDDVWGLQHADARITSFYVKLAVSPCGRWLASGGAADGRAYLFDVGASATRGRALLGRYAEPARAVRLCGQTGEIGAVDWAEGMLATCSDAGTVRVWRPDVEVSRRCKENTEQASWEWSWGVDDDTRTV